MHGERGLRFTDQPTRYVTGSVRRDIVPAAIRIHSSQLSTVHDRIAHILEETGESTPVGPTIAVGAVGLELHPRGLTLRLPL